MRLFDQGPELLWQVPIQEIQHRPDPFLKPRRKPALPAQIFFQVFHLHFELPVFISSRCRSWASFSFSFVEGIFC